MSKPAMEDLFKFSGRRNRKSYVLYFLIIMAIMMVAGLVVMGLVATVPVLGFLLAVVVFVPIAISSWAVGSQRCRDFGWTGWAILLTAVPYVGLLAALAFMFVPGTQGTNRYGPDPLGGQSPVPTGA